VVTVCGVALSCAGEAVRFDGAVEESAKESVVPLTPETTVVIEGCPEPVTVATLEVCARPARSIFPALCNPISVWFRLPLHPGRRCGVVNGRAKRKNSRTT
jgi:hypothetical protein